MCKAVSTSASLTPLSALSHVIVHSADRKRGSGEVADKSVLGSIHACTTGCVATSKFAQAEMTLTYLFCFWIETCIQSYNIKKTCYNVVTCAPVHIWVTWVNAERDDKVNERPQYAATSGETARHHCFA